MLEVGQGRRGWRVGWGKIVDSIYDSSLMDHGPVVRSIFMDFVVLADREDKVRLSARRFALKTGWELKQVREALAVLTEPDGDSKSKIHEGRRLIQLEEENESAGYFVVNRGKYKYSTPEERRAQKAAWAAKKRAASRSGSLGPNQLGVAVGWNSDEAKGELEDFRS